MCRTSSYCALNTGRQVAVNVPYLIPAPAFGLDKFKVVKSRTSGNKSVVFAPHEWRGTRGAKSPFGRQMNLNVTEMAAQINGYKRGTVTAIYLTSDGGGNLGDIDQLVGVLENHVQVVGNEIGAMALAAAAAAAAANGSHRG